MVSLISYHVWWPSALYFALSQFSRLYPFITSVRAIWEAEDATLHFQIHHVKNLMRRRWGSEVGSILFKASCICTWVFITNRRVSSLYLTSEVRGSLKSFFSAANLRPNQYSLSNHLQKKGLGHSRELQQRDGERMGEGGGEAIHPAAQIRLWGWKTHSEYGEAGEHGS